MSKIVVSNKFKRAFRKFTRRNTKLQGKIEVAITKLSEDIFDPSLGQGYFILISQRINSLSYTLSPFKRT